MQITLFPLKEWSYINRTHSHHFYLISRYILTLPYAAAGTEQISRLLEEKQTLTQQVAAFTADREQLYAALQTKHNVSEWSE